MSGRRRRVRKEGANAATATSASASTTQSASASNNASASATSGGSQHRFDHDAINGMVREYLVYAGLDEAVSGFDAGLKAKGQPLSAKRRRQSETIRNARKHARVQGAMLNALRAGDAKAFFSLWSAHLPTALLAKDLTARKLEFYVNIFFAIYPLHPWNTLPRDAAALAKSMTAFTGFLSKKGAALCKTSEFVAYYALPYVPNPTEHPSFRELFLDEWASNLVLRLERFLAAVLRTTNVPQVVTLYAAHAASASAPGSPVARARVAASASSLTSLQYQHVLALARELAETCSTLLRAAPVAPEYLGSLAARLVSADVIPPGSEDLLTAPPPTVPHGLPVPVPVPTPAATPSPPPTHTPHAAPGADAEMPIITSMAPLSYAKVRSNLGPRSPLSAQAMTLLLQALRWRLTRSRPARLRKKVMQAYIESDLFALHAPTQARDGLSASLLAHLLVHSAGTVQDYAARLVNTMASEFSGRNYLLETGETVEVLASVLFNEPDDTETRQACLGALQKFSLRNGSRDRMIELNIIAWLVAVLDNADELSEYTVEYGAALLMNLSLRAAGRERCAEPELDILTVLARLLSYDVGLVRTYVNGTLYSILARAPLKDRAHALGMERMLVALKDDNDPEFTEQLDFILSQLAAPPVAAADDAAAELDAGPGDDHDEDDEEYADDYLAEDETDESIRAPPSVPQGEALLSSKYLASLEDALEEERTVDRVLAAQQLVRDARDPPPVPSRDEPVPVRPVTPAHSSSRPASRRSSRPPSASSDSLDIDTDVLLAENPSDDSASDHPASDAHSDSASDVASDFDDNAADDDDDVADIDISVDDAAAAPPRPPSPDSPPPEAVPDPLVSKPKIPRTPPGGRSSAQRSLNASASTTGGASAHPAPVDDVAGRPVVGITRPPPTPKVMAGEYDEFVAAFSERDKVPRTPAYPPSAAAPPTATVLGANDDFDFDDFGSDDDGGSDDVGDDSDFDELLL